MFQPKLTSSQSLLCLLVLMRLQYSCSRPTHSKAIKYLVKYGYLTKKCNRCLPTIVHGALKRAVMRFHEMAGICTTGNIDKATMKAIVRPRCGNKDVLETDTAGRQKRYALSGYKWQNTMLTFRVVNFTPSLLENDTEEAFQQAAYIWSNVSGLSITKNDSNSSRIKIEFVMGDQKGRPFDGPGGELARSLYPEEGNIYFDGEENWTLGTPSGTNLLQIATHEFGHVLGLGHSTAAGSVISPMYEGYITNFKLGKDDRAGIRELYGPNTKQELGSFI